MVQLLFQVVYILVTTAAADWLARRLVQPVSNKRQRLLRAGLLWVLFSILIVVVLWLIFFAMGVLQASDNAPFGTTGITIAGLLFFSFAGSILNIFIAGMVILINAIKPSLSQPHDQHGGAAL